MTKITKDIFQNLQNITMDNNDISGFDECLPAIAEGFCPECYP